MRAALTVSVLLFAIIKASAQSGKATAADQKLAGAAKTSFTKKCVSNLVGT